MPSLPFAIGRRRPLLVCCSLILALACGCDSRDETMVGRSDLESIEIGEMVKLKRLLKKPAEAVCVLDSHQGSLSDTKGPLAEKINAYLAKKHYVDDDLLWGFVFVEGNSVAVQVFETSERLGLCKGRPNLSKEMRAVECASAGDAVVTRVYRFGGPCLLFGQAR